MAGNVLQFALGLSAQGFLSQLSVSKVALAGFAAAATGLGGVLAGVFSQIHRGAALNDLSNRTGESVGNLVKLQRGFEETGVAAESVTGIISALQRSLGGVNEMGEPTANIFEAIGLSIDKLKKMDTPAALIEIFGALRNLNRNDAASAAGKIFGRGNGGNILQAARQGEDFLMAMKRAGQESAIFERSAAAMDRMLKSLHGVKVALDTVFAGLAEKFTGLVKMAQQAFGDGKMDQFVYLAIASGFERAFSFGAALFSDPQLWRGMQEGMKAAVSGAAFMNPLFHAMSVGAGVSKDLLKADWNKIYKEAGADTPEKQGQARRAFVTKSFLSWENAATAVDEGAPFAAAEAMQKALKNTAAAFKNAANVPAGAAELQFGKLLEDLAARIKPEIPVPIGNDKLGATKSAGGKGGAAETADALTRIGFFAGGRSDPNQETARNTTQLVALTRKMVAQIGRLGGTTTDFANA